LAQRVLNPKDPIQRVLDQIFQTLKDRVQTPKVLLPQNPVAVEHSGAVWRLRLKVEPD
jgi:hemin uptake protein HemP